ncbi:hypothetical protein [Pyrobaculum aerophilum]|uniref:hypothetical protein n=1 Tax=Pyrobaculum aerophilum TaxID=13773 RepID=UPI002FDA90C4
MLPKLPLIALGAVLLVIYARAYGIEDVVFLKVDLEEDVFPYVVIGREIEPVPIVEIYVNQTAYFAEEGVNITVPVPVGRYVAVPRKAFNNFARGHPRAFDLEVEGLGKVRLVLPRNATELGESQIINTPRGKAIKTAGRLELWVFAEERNGKLYIGNKPLDIREPKNQPPRRQPLKEPEKAPARANGEVGTTDYASNSTTVNAYGSYLFAPLVHANVVDSKIYTASTAARFWIANGFDGKKYTFYGKDDWKSHYAYLGYGVQRVYVHVAWRRGDPEPGPYAWLNVRYYTQPGQLPNSVWLYQSPLEYRFENVYRKIYVFDVSQYSNYYIEVYTDILSTGRPLNISIMVVYRRPADPLSAYGLLRANWRWDLVQPGGWLGVVLDYSKPIKSVVFVARIAPGASADAWLWISNFKVKTCTNTNTQSVTVILGSRVVTTLTSSRYVGTFDGCREFVFDNGPFGTYAWVRLEDAAKWWYAANATTYLPLYLVFDPPVTRGWTPAELKNLRVSLWGYRWPEIWRENSRTWISGRAVFPDVPVSRGSHVRDIFMYTVWLSSTRYNETVDPITLRSRLAYADIRLTSQMFVGYEYTTPNGRLTYSYLKWGNNVELRKVCVAVVGSANVNYVGSPITMDIYIQYPYKYDINWLVSATNAAVYIVGTILTFISLFYTNPLIVAGSLAVWGIDSLLKTVQTPQEYTCSPSSYYVSSGYNAGTYGKIDFAHIYIGGVGTPQTRGVALTERIMYHEATYSTYVDINLAGYYYYLTFLRVHHDDAYRIFNGPEEPYAMAWSGFFVEFK